MTYDFFADEVDKIKILEFIFNETNIQIFDLSSVYGQEIRKYESVNDIQSAFDLSNADIFFNLWSPDFKGKITFKEIKLDPKRCSGFTYRYVTEGWGLIQLYFHGRKNNTLKYSHIGHFNEKGALKWEDVNTYKGKVSDWDWATIQKTSSRLKRAIQSKMLAKCVQGFDILEGADNLQKLGIQLTPIFIS